MRIIVYEEERAGEIVVSKAQIRNDILPYGPQDLITNMNKNNVPSAKTRKCTGTQINRLLRQI